MSAYSYLAHLVTFRPLERPIRCDYLPSPFGAPWSSTVEVLARELDMLRAGDVILQVDLREQDFRADGLPRADRRANTDGVVLSIGRSKVGTPLRYEAGRFTGWQDNVRALALGLEALRKVDRYGIGAGNEQYAGWKQLPTGTDSAPSVDRGRELIRQHGGVTAALKATHPDHGGDPADFRDVQAAREAGAR